MNTKTMQQSDLDDLMEENLDISAWGYRIPTENQTRYEEGRVLLRNSLKAVNSCIKYISLTTPRKNINYNHTSYGYKHFVEHYCKAHNDPHYIPQGAFIFASFFLGVRCKQEKKEHQNAVMAVGDLMQKLNRREGEWNELGRSYLQRLPY